MNMTLKPAFGLSGSALKVIAMICNSQDLF